ncbi:MAG TPA: rod shape-determining protein [Patescibacteria group bacterium]|nr:rod shape-determining protein [Patescibacteria group bacterium]
MRIKIGKIKYDFSKLEFPGLSRFWKIFSYDMAVDLGTANTLVWIQDQGIVIHEPSVIARNKKTKEILAVGKDAKKMMGRSPQSIEVIRPLKDGVIADFDAAEVMLSHYIKKVHEPTSMLPKIPKPRVTIGIPSGVTEVERKAVGDAVLSAGAREANLVEEPMAAAIGAGLAVEKPEGKFIIDIGGGTSEIAVISLGGIVVGRSLRIAGDEMNEAIINYVKLKYSLLLGETTAEDVKISIGNFSDEKEKFHVVRGRDLESGLPKSIKLTTHEVREALTPVAHEIINGVTATLEETPPELLSDIMEGGIILAGGGALVGGIDKLISEKTQMPVRISDNPMSCVVMGCAELLNNKRLLNKIRVTKGK